MQEQVINNIQQSIKNKGLDPQQVSKYIFDTNKDNPDYWNYLSKDTKLTSEFIIEHLDKLDINNLCYNQKLDNSITTNNKFIQKLNCENWDNLIQNQHLNEDTIELYIQYCKDNEKEIDWISMSKDQKLPMNIIKNYSDFLDWYWISQEQFMIFEFIIEFREKINWEVLAFNEELQYMFTDAFVHLFEAKPIWKHIGLMEQVTSECLEMYFDRIDINAWYIIFENKEITLSLIEKVLTKYEDVSEDLWDYLSQNAHLSDDIIEKYQNDLDWNMLSLNHKFDINTIYKYKDKINLTKLSCNDCLTLDMIKNLEKVQDQFQSTFDWEYISEFGNINKEYIDTSENIIKNLAKFNDNL